MALKLLALLLTFAIIKMIIIFCAVRNLNLIAITLRCDAAYTQCLI